MPQIDIDRALNALDGNKVLLKDLASMFVEDAPVLLAQLKTALADFHPMKARALVHGLKGLVATFFAKEGVEIAQRLEDSAADGDLSIFSGVELGKLENSINSIIADFVVLGWLKRP